MSEIEDRTTWAFFGGGADFILYERSEIENCERSELEKYYIPKNIQTHNNERSEIVVP